MNLNELHYLLKRRFIKLLTVLSLFSRGGKHNSSCICLDIKVSSLSFFMIVVAAKAEAEDLSNL